MFRVTLLLLVACAVASAVEVPETLVVDGQTYKGVVYQSHDASRLKIMHESGVASLPIANLPADLHAKLGYRPEAAAAAETAFQEKQAKAQAQQQADLATANMYAEQLAHSIVLNVKVSRVKGRLIWGDRDGVGLFHNKGKALERLENSSNASDREQAKRLSTLPEYHQTFVVVGYPKTDTIAEGETIQIRAVRIENYEDSSSTYMQYKYLRDYNMAVDYSPKSY